MAHDTDGPQKGEVRFENGRPVHTDEDEDDENEDAASSDE